MRIQRRYVLKSVLGAALVLALAVGPAAAAAGDVVVGGVLILRIRTAAGGVDASQRAVIVEQRITDALTKSPSTAATVLVQRVGGQPVIFVNGVMIVTVDANHARLNGTTPFLLAEIWARQLMEALPKAIPVPQQPGA